MAREEMETCLLHFGNVLPFLKDKSDMFDTLKDMLRSISNLRWMQEDKPGGSEKDYATVERLAELLEEKIAQKENRREAEDKDNDAKD